MGNYKYHLMAAAAAMAIIQSAPAWAQEASDEGSGADIIVTARRTEERLQDVPISITVFNQTQLNDRNVVTATDLATYTPSLSVNQRFGPEKSSFSIRGFIQEIGTAPSVGVYFADVVAPRSAGGTTSGNTAVTGSFMDLQNVQVLKGPQGTLFGRNTTGGAVLLVPQKPTDKLEGYIEGSAGNYDMWRLQGVLNVPLSDTFRVRFAADRQKRDGYMKNHSGVGPDAYNDVNYFAGRMSIVADLTPELENYLIASYSHSFTKGNGGRILACNPAFLPSSGFRISSSAQLSPGLLAPAACDQVARQNARGDGAYDVEIRNPNPYLDLEHWQVINTTTWVASDMLTLKNIASYQEFREKSNFTLNSENFSVSNPAPQFSSAAVAAAFGFSSASPFTPGTPFGYIVLGQQGNRDTAAQSTFTEELQLQGHTGDGKLSYQLGGYLEISRPLGLSAGYSGILVNCTDPAVLACINTFGTGSISASRRKTSFDSKGLYGQATYKFTDQLSLTAGMRYTWDSQSVTASDTRISLRPTGNVETCNDVIRFNSGVGPTGAPIALAVSDPSRCLYTFRQKSARPTWLIDLEYKPIDDLMVYGKYSRGYRAGGVGATAVGFEQWGPEKVEAYEVGAKSSWSGAFKGYFNIAGFYNDFSDQQITANAISNLPGFAGSSPIINAGKSRIWGVEVDASATVFKGLRLDVGYTYLNTKLLAINLPSIPAGAPYSSLVATAVVGGNLALSPKNRVTLTGTYTLPLDESFGRLSFGATFIHTDRQTVTLATVPNLAVVNRATFLDPNDDLRFAPATNLLNLNVNWDNVFDTPIDLAFFMTNATNKKVRVNVGSVYNSAGFEAGSYGSPRMFGVRAKVHFGQ